MSQTPPVTSQAPSGGFNLRRLVILVAGGLIAVLVLLFVGSLVLALVTDIERAAPVVRMIRDVVIIFLALEGVLIVLGLAMLILQIARLVNVLQTEVKPILQDAQETIKTAQGSVEFIGNHIGHGVARGSAFFAGTSFLTRELFGLRRALRRARVNAEIEEGER